MPDPVIDPVLDDPEDLLNLNGDDPENLGGEEDDPLDPDLDLDKPVTKKDLLDFRKEQESIINNRFANRRHEQKKPLPYQSGSKKIDKGEDNPLDARIGAIELNNRKYDFGQEHGLSRKAVDLVFKFADGKPTAKTLENPFVKGGLERLKTQASLRDNTPDGSGSSGFEVDGKKWEDMKPEEKKANFAARQKAILSKRK